jgi:hypothetical protein
MNPNGPFPGWGFQQGLPALGVAIAPFASPNAPINQNRCGSLQSLQGAGAVIDMVNSQ